MLEKLKEQKLRIAIIVIAGCLIFYAVGNATNLFANPAFRMFWIINNETAHSIAIYGAIAGAVAAVTIGLAVALIKKRKTSEPQTTYKPVIPIVKPTNQTPVKTTFPTYPTYKPTISSLKPTNQTPVKAKPPTYPTYKSVIPSAKTTNQTPAKATLPSVTLKMEGKITENKIEQEIEPPKQPIIKPTAQLAAQIPTEPTIDQNKTNNQRIDTNMPANGKFNCPKCKKEFSTPLFMLEYVQSKPKLVRHCPYCDESLD